MVANILLICSGYMDVDQVNDGINPTLSNSNSNEHKTEDKSMYYSNSDSEEKVFFLSGVTNRLHQNY